MDPCTKVYESGLDPLKRIRRHFSHTWQERLTRQSFNLLVCKRSQIRSRRLREKGITRVQRKKDEWAFEIGRKVLQLGLFSGTDQLDITNHFIHFLRKR